MKTVSIHVGMHQLFISLCAVLAVAFCISVPAAFADGGVDITHATISGVEAGYAYTGSPIKPEPTVVANVNGTNVTLTNGVDYMITYKNSVGVVVPNPTRIGSYKVIVAGMNNIGKGGYFGTVSVPFTIDTASSDFKYSINDSKVYIEGYIGSDKSVMLPDTIEGKPVVSAVLNDCRLTSLNVSTCASLVKLDCSKNCLTSLKLYETTNNTLESLTCSSNELGLLSASNCKALKELNCNNDQLQELYLPATDTLTSLSCTGNQLRELHVDACPALEELDFNNNSVEAVDLSKNAALTLVNCSDNKLTSLDVSASGANLKKLYCSGNKLSSLGVGASTALEELDCAGNRLGALDVSGNAALAVLRCAHNYIADTSALAAWLAGAGHSGEATPQDSFSIADAKVSGVKAGYAYTGSAIAPEPTVVVYIGVMDDLTTMGAKVTLSKGTDYTCVYRDSAGAAVDSPTDAGAYSAEITGTGSQSGGFYGTVSVPFAIGSDYNGFSYYADAAGAHVVGYTGTGKDVVLPAAIGGKPVVSAVLKGCGLTSLDASACASLADLDCSRNNGTFKTLTLYSADNVTLKSLDCSYNGLSSLDVSHCEALEKLNASCNDLTTLNVSENTALHSFNCLRNDLTGLDLSKNTSLQSLDCSENALAYLDVSACASLTDLDCSASNGNTLKTLTLYSADNGTLKSLKCDLNDLSSLDAGHCTALTSLNCSSDNLATLDLSKCTALQSLDCSSNPFNSGLNLGGNTALTSLNCNGDKLTELDLSKNTALKSLSCSSNNLATLDISKNAALNYLDCPYNNIKNTTSLEEWLTEAGHYGWVIPQITNTLVVQAEDGVTLGDNDYGSGFGVTFTSGNSLLGTLTISNDSWYCGPAYSDTATYHLYSNHITLSVTASAGYVPSINVQGASFQYDAIFGVYSCSLDLDADTQTLVLSFTDSSKVSMAVANGFAVDTTTTAGAFTFKTSDGAATVATMMATDNGTAVTTNPFSLSSSAGTHHISLVFSSLAAAYQPAVTYNGTAQEVSFDSGTGCYICSFDTSGGGTLAVSFSEQPGITIATDSNVNQMTHAADGTFTFKAADGETTLGVMTAVDGSGKAYTTNPFYVADNDHVELTITTTDASYSPFVTGTNDVFQQDQTDKTKWTLDIPKPTTSATLTVQIAWGRTLSLPAIYDSAYQDSYGTVEWSTSEGGTYQPINVGTIVSTSTSTNQETGETTTLYNYTFISNQAVYIKATWPATNSKGFTAIEAPGAFEGGSLDNGVAKQLIGSGSLQYDDWYAVSWAYDSNSPLINSTEDFVANGKIIVTNVTGGVDPERNLIESDGSGNGGLVVLSSDATVTIKFIPDPGYQFTGVKANGKPVDGLMTASEELYTYTCTAKGIVHFSNAFEKCDDVVTVKATKVASATLANGAHAAGNGSAELAVTDSLNVSNDTQTQMRDAAGKGATIESIIGLTFSQVVSKGNKLEVGNINSNTAWIMQKTELSEPVTVSIVLDKSIKISDDYTISVIRNHKNANGTSSIAQIDSTYDAATRTLEFSSNLFSDYAIATIPKTSRLFGEARYDTMASIVQKGFPDGSCKTVVLATGVNFPDALAASGLAGLYKSPVILIDGKATEQFGITSSKAFSEIKRVDAKNIVIVGGESAVSSQIKNQLVDAGYTVTRFFGETRQDTALSIYEAGKTVVHGTSTGWGKTVIIASSGGSDNRKFADALSISPISYTSSSPIFLTDNNGDLTPGDKTAITAGIKLGDAQNGIAHVVIVGGVSAVSSNAETWLVNTLGKGNVVRLGGADRYETSGIIADFSVGAGAYSAYPAKLGYTALGYSLPGIATGTNFPDALAGAALCGSRSSVLLLASDSNYSAAITRLSANKSTIVQVEVFGGDKAVSPQLYSAIDEAVR